MTDQNPKRKVLGKGLGALLSSKTSAAPPPEPVVEKPADTTLAIDEIQANPLQPRIIFDPPALHELALSIRANGIIQPLVVRMVDGKPQLIAGERRLRAAKIAGLERVPVVIREIDEARLLEITLVENIQREDLNPLEVADAYQRMMLELGLTHEQIAERTGKERSTVTNHLRLLRLPGDVQQYLASGQLSMGHARTLIAIEDAETQIALAKKAAEEGLSVRQLEQLARAYSSAAKKEKEQPSAQPTLDANWKAAIQELQRVLGTKVSVQLSKKGNGKLEIEFYSHQDLQRIYELLAGDSDN